MDEETKGFLIGLAIVCTTIVAIVSCSEYSNMWHVEQGYEWVPRVDGHWEKSKLQQEK